MASDGTAWRMLRTCPPSPCTAQLAGIQSRNARQLAKLAGPLGSGPEARLVTIEGENDLKPRLALQPPPDGCRELLPAQRDRPGEFKSASSSRAHTGIDAALDDRDPRGAVQCRGVCSAVTG
jgi:hypothetical protein